ncbi:hypothetical protein INT45_002178 [Circinella minor]|uniref:Uncharacterized protein n=1 Tax=Circinella minor TaxID=1195481 RepID=A0A8H7RZP1_9FUNG|nr:hypothetical protein INT45_002178 [Circinella minor]
MISSAGVVKKFHDHEKDTANNDQNMNDNHLTSEFDNPIVSDNYSNRTIAKDRTMIPSAKVNKAIVGGNESTAPNHSRFLNINKPLPEINIGQSLTLASSDQLKEYPRIHLKRHDAPGAARRVRRSVERDSNDNNESHSKKVISAQQRHDSQQSHKDCNKDGEKNRTNNYDCHLISNKESMNNQYFNSHNHYNNRTENNVSQYQHYKEDKDSSSSNRSNSSSIYSNRQTRYYDVNADLDEMDSSSGGDDRAMTEKSEYDTAPATTSPTAQSTPRTFVTPSSNRSNSTNNSHNNSPLRNHHSANAPTNPDDTTVTPGVEDNTSTNVSDQALAVFRATRARPQLPIYERLVRLYKDAMVTPDFVLKVQCATYILNKLSTLPKDDIKNNDLSIAAVKLLMKLAKSQGMAKPGHPDAQFVLGNCYGTGAHGVTFNPEKAFNCYWLGSKQHHPECTYRVAVCYEVGAGTKQNSRRAFEYLKKSAKMGFAPAMYKLGMVLTDASQSPDSRREGVSWLKRAVQRTPDDPDLEALHTLGCAFETTGFALVPDIAFAREVFMQAADLGYAPSQYRLALACESGHLDIPTDERLAVIWATKAAFQGHADAQFLMSTWHLKGTMAIHAPQNSDLAYRWARQAAENGHTRAMYALAIFYEFGIGVEVDKKLAVEWLHIAAANNDKLAIHRLRELKKEETASCPVKKKKRTEKIIQSLQELKKGAIASWPLEKKTVEKKVQRLRELKKEAVASWPLRKISLCKKT